MWSAEALPRSEDQPPAQSIPTPTEPLVADVTGRFSTPPPAASPSGEAPMFADASAAPAESVDEEEAHLRDTFDKFLALRAETGESVHLSYDRFATKLRQNRDQAADELVVRSAAFAGGLECVEVGRRSGVDRDQRAETYERMRLGVEPRLREICPLAREQALDEGVVPYRELAQRALVALHRSLHLTPVRLPMHHPPGVNLRRA